MIDLEKPKSRIFKDGSNDLHPVFRAELDQIDRWSTRFNSNVNKGYFTKLALSFIRQPMCKNPSCIKYVLASGGREDYQDIGLKKPLVHSNERLDFKIT